MTWIKLDDNFPEHPKILGLSDKAFRLYIELLCYCGRVLTDGHIKKVALERLDTKLVYTELIEGKLLDETEDGVYIRGYDEWQTLKADIDKLREQGRVRQKRYNAKNNALMTEADTDTDTDTEDRIQTQNTDTDTFNEFWSVYPRKAGKQAALKAWLSAIKKIDCATILEGAKRYASDPNRVEQFTAHASTWLNQGRWEDAPLPSRTPNYKSERELKMDSFNQWLQQQETENA